LRCGACCAFYRASFHWSEAEDFACGGVPLELTRKLTEHRLVMRGTEGSHPRCVALGGIIGKRAFCSIYGRRPSVCRQFEPSWSIGVPNPDCDKARLAWGLRPLNPMPRRFPGRWRKAA